MNQKITLSSKYEKEQLQKQLNVIAERERKEFIKKHYPEFKKLEGKYFKYRNSYGHGTGWWLYKTVTEIKESDVYDTGSNGPACRYKGWSFEICSNGHISIETIKSGYTHSLETEITKKEFNAAWNKMIDKLNNL